MFSLFGDSHDLSLRLDLNRGERASDVRGFPFVVEQDLRGSLAETNPRRLGRVYE